VAQLSHQFLRSVKEGFALGGGMGKSGTAETMKRSVTTAE